MIFTPSIQSTLLPGAVDVGGSGTCIVGIDHLLVVAFTSSVSAW